MLSIPNSLAELTHKNFSLREITCKIISKEHKTHYNRLTLGVDVQCVKLAWPEQQVSFRTESLLPSYTGMPIPHVTKTKLTEHIRVPTARKS